MNAPKVLGLVVAVAVAGALDAQSKADDSKFEVASIRPGNPEINRVGIRFTPGGGLQASNISLKFLVQMAYDVQQHQISGGQGWMDSDRYEVTAKGPEGAPHHTPEEDRRLARVRLQNLLAERFQLVVRREKKEGQGYALLVAKGGSKLTESKSPETRGIRQSGRGELTADGVPIELLANVIGRQMGKTVVDKTGLTGRYDFSLRWTPQPGEGGGLFRGPGPGPGPAEAADAAGPTLFTALQEQLGLRLEAQKIMADYIVIEKGEKPSEN
ncbi:MAG: TIGR03435 family protein [Bryobacteraceae bacterium]